MTNVGLLESVDSYTSPILPIFSPLAPCIVLPASEVSCSVLIIVILSGWGGGILVQAVVG